MVGMRNGAARYSTPLDVNRPRGARLLEGYSPKLGRRITLFDRAKFDQWLRLEADPTVLQLCERPIRLEDSPDARVIDFWVRRADGERLLLVGDVDGKSLPATVADISIQHVGLTELAAAAQWSANWQRMLPTIVATQAWRARAFCRTVQAYASEPMALSRLERVFSTGDPPVARGVVFELLRTGRLGAPSLHSQPLSLMTLFGPPP
jgi:hypothetical protein